MTIRVPRRPFGLVAGSALWLFAASGALAQPEMRSIFSVFDEQAFDVRTYVDGGSILVGRRAVSPTLPSDILVIRLDSSGDTVWQRQIGTAANDDIGYCSAIVPDGSFAVAATTNTAGVGFEILVIRMTPAGAINWSFAYRGSGTPDESGVSIRHDRPTGHFVVTGRVDTGNGIFRPVMFRIDGAGNIVWHRTYFDPQNFANYRGLNDLDLANDGTIYATGDVILATPAPGDRNLWLMRTDAGGIPIFSSAYGQPGAGGPSFVEYGNSIDLIDNTTGNAPDVLVAGPANPPAIPVGSNSTVVMRTNGNGVSTWQRVLSKFTIAPVALRRALDNQFVMAGKDTGAGLGAPSGILTSLDFTGVFKFRTRFLFSPEHGLQGVAIGPTVANGYRSAGESLRPTTQRDVWFVHADNNGRTFCEDQVEGDELLTPSMTRTVLAINSNLSTVRVPLTLPISDPQLANRDVCPPPCPERCNPADIAFDNGVPLPPFSPCDAGVNNGVTEADYNLFFANYFDANPVCDIAYDDGSPLPPFGPPGGTNNGVTEGDYNLFFAIYFDGCQF